MKVALCFSGQPRNALQTYDYFKKNIIDANNADVFIHMNYDNDNLYIEKSHSNNGNCLLDKDLDKKIIDLYKPKRYLIEAPKNFNKQNIQIDEKRLERSKKMNAHMNWSNEDHEKYILKQLTSHLYSVHKCNELKELYANENGFFYDYVIFVRFDLFLYQPIICNNLDPDFIYYIEMSQPDEMISDWLNIGSNAIMNIYSSRYLTIDYFNTFKFYKLSDRPSHEPSINVGGAYEHLLRDIMHFHKIPKKGLNICCELKN